MSGDRDLPTPGASLAFRITRAVRRALGVDRERRWNAQYAAGTWTRLRTLDELAHHAVLAGYFARLKPGGSLLEPSEPLDGPRAQLASTSVHRPRARQHLL